MKKIDKMLVTLKRTLYSRKIKSVPSGTGTSKGITLIALVITIIILVILAGITISSLAGENGLFGKIKLAVEKHKEAEAKEQAQLDEFYKQLGLENEPPKNTPDTEAGTVVALEEGWGLETVNYYKTTDGTEVKNLEKVSTVYAVSVGNGDTVPVPKGFYYVGGTLDTGVVISDNPNDKNKYAGIEDVPSGVTYNSDGTVDEANSELKGNQFVWIPCTANEYAKKDWGKANATYETTTHGTELPQIQKYGGFYVGRYEAGTSNITLSTEINFANQNTATAWRNDDFSIRNGLNHTVTGKITTKAGEIPYYHTDYFTALKLSNSMYNTDYVQSVLVTGTMWDVIMKFIAGDNNSIVTSSNWGNYNNGNLTYTEGKGRYAIINSSGGMDSAFTRSNGNFYYGIKTTAISEDVKKKNLYDIAGNLWEWTQEASYPNNANESYMLRGGSFCDSYSDVPVCYRFSTTANATDTVFGFRPALFIK